MKSLLSFAVAALGLAGSPQLLSAADAPPLKVPPTDVVQFDHGKVDSVFARGGALLLNNRYKVQSGRRVTSGPAEIHTYDTDIFYVLTGSATFVTGGTAEEVTNIGPGEAHAKSITGGTERHLSKGDVIIIPKGVPHQFTQVDGPFTYFVVKVKE